MVSISLYCCHPRHMNSYKSLCFAAVPGGVVDGQQDALIFVPPVHSIDLLEVGRERFGQPPIRALTGFSLGVLDSFLV